MATFKVYPNGATCGNTGTPSEHERISRDVTKGWSVQVSSRLRKWFYSIDTTQLTGYGYAFTLTVGRKVPESPKIWATLRRNFEKRANRKGAIRFHWLTEWQRRGAPHLHGVVYFDSEIWPCLIIQDWLQVSRRYETQSYGQDCKPIENVRGWLEYLTKHAARSAVHYQRSPENIPKEWKTNTGRMWGYSGDWPIREVREFFVDQKSFYIVRRLLKRHLVATLRDRLAVKQDSGLRKALTHARRKLKCTDKGSSRFMGVSNWMDASVALQALDFLRQDGGEIHRMVEGNSVEEQVSRPALPLITYDEIRSVEYD